MSDRKDDAAQAASLELTGVNFRYPGGDKLALSDINVSVEAASISALVGPSGCGKSTLLKTVGGMIAPEDGQVLIGGNDVTHTPMTKRKIGWVPQQYALFEHMDVKSNVAFGLRAQKFPKTQRVERVKEMLELCQMTEFADRAVDELSGGQRQRVAIARALAPYPRLLLLDEPLAALDPQLRGKLRADLRKMIRDAGVTTIIVTHDQEEALAMADHLVVMKKGEVAQSGAPSKVWSRPETAWVASFLGNAQVIPVLKNLDGNRSEIAPGLDVPTTGDGGSRVAVRPVDFVVESAEHAEGVEAEIIDSEFHGDSYAVTVRLHGEHDDLVLPARSHAEREPGEVVRVKASNHREVPEVR